MLPPDTYRLIEQSVQAWRETDGRFDPTVLPALEAIGYDRSFQQIAADGFRVSSACEQRAVPGCADIDLHPQLRSVTLPVGVALDLGGIGKGAAADKVAESVIERGARGVCINVGGDLRVLGDPPDDVGWLTGIDHWSHPGAHHDTISPIVVGLVDGAVCTTTRVKRAWRSADSRCHHHLIDPSTGRSAWTGLQAVTVLDATAVRAEVLAKAAFVAGPTEGAAIIERAGATGLFVTDDHERIPLPGLEQFLR